MYGDLYAGAIWAAIENPEKSGNFLTTKIPFSCAHDTPIQCSYESSSDLAALGYLFSFGEDNNKDVFILAQNGVYRVVRPSRCNYTCTKENVTTAFASPTARSFANRIEYPRNILLLLLASLLLLL